MRIGNDMNTSEIVIVSTGVRNFELTWFSARRRIYCHNETDSIRRNPERLRAYVERNRTKIPDSFHKNYEGNSLTYWRGPDG